MKRPDRPVGIIGAGRLGQAMARTALRAGRPVVIANSRGPESKAAVASALGDGASAGTVADAAASGSEMQRVGAPLAGATSSVFPTQDHEGERCQSTPNRREVSVSTEQRETLEGHRLRGRVRRRRARRRHPGQRP